MPKRPSYYQQDILSIMQKFGVDNLEAERIYRKQTQDQELDPKIANQYALEDN